MFSTRRKCWSVATLLLLALTSFASARPAAAAEDELCFPQTQQCISGRFRQYWEQNGGLSVFGYPLTAASYERSRDTGVVYLTQWFERNSFELHPENAPPYDVLLGRLSDYRLFQLNRLWRDEPRASGPKAGCTWFAETQHNVCDQAPSLGFKSYLLAHGLSFDGTRGISPQESLALLGLPLTEARIETNSSGDTVLTQWFERARLEWHPDKPEPYKVLLGLLGSEVRNHVPPLKTSCETPVIDELRRHYEQGRTPGRITFQQGLGCPQYVIRDIPAATQRFEGGTMLWHATTSTRGSPPGWIFATFTSSYPLRYISYADEWQEGQPETGGATPPAGKYEPRRGFGKVWREQQGVRTGLGWATEPEREERAVLQVFEHGSMIWLQNSDTVYVFFHDPGPAVFGERIK